jgi:hypothetical protein
MDVLMSLSDSVYPIFSDYYDNNGSTYFSSGLALFNVTVSNTNGTVILSINSTNYTSSNISTNVFNASISGLTNGTYSYYWISFGNGSSNNLNTSAIRSYTVNVTPRIGLSVIYPTTNINVSQNGWFNVTLNVTCLAGSCGGVNVSLDPTTYSTCYQESANTTNQTGIDGDCGLDYSGEYSSSGIVNVNNAYDGNWSSTIGSNDGNIYINYTKPSGALNTSLWQIAIASNNPENLTIDENCWNYNQNKLLLNVNVASGKCLDENTKISTTSGYKKVKEIKKGDLVYSFEKGNLTINNVTWVGNSTSTLLYEIFMDDGNTINVTSNHEFYRDGDYIEASKLAIGDSLTNINLKNIKIINIKLHNRNVTVWDVSIANSHNFFANNLLVHNIGSTIMKCYNGTGWKIIDSNPDTAGGFYEEAMIWNISSTSGKGLINTTTGATPFYTNVSNPFNISLGEGESQTVVFWVNATGNADTTYEFFAYANLTSNLSISNVTETWNVSIIEGATSYAIELSSALAEQINWSLASLPVYNQSSDGNNGTGITEYFVNVSTEGGTVDLYVKANDNLMTQGLDVIGLGNETYSFNSTNSSVPADIKYSLTTNYSDNKIGTSLSNGAVVYLKFFLSAPPGQAAGTYNNSLMFKVVSSGQNPG